MLGFSPADFSSSVAVALAGVSGILHYSGRFCWQSTLVCRVIFEFLFLLHVISAFRTFSKSGDWIYFIGY